MHTLFHRAGLRQIETAPIEITTRFDNLDDFGEPLLGGIGPAPSFVASLSTDDQRRLELMLRQRLLVGDKHATIELMALAWAVRGVL